MGMRDHARGYGTGAVAQRADVAAPTPGKATLIDDSATDTPRPSTFEGYHWEDLDVGNVNAIEAAAAGKGDGGGDDDALDAKDSAATASSQSPHAREPGGKHEPGGTPETGGTHATPDAGSGIHIITRAGLRHLRHAGAKGRHAAQVLYNNPDAYIVLKEGQTMPRGWKAKATILFPSYAEFEAAHQQGRIPHGIAAVVYDNEHWAQTPRVEKTHAIHYAKRFGELAQRLGLVYIAAPTQKWFAADARFADIIDLQLQGRENHTNAYARAVKHDVKLAHHLNPNIDVVAQITSNRNHLDPDHSGNIGAGIHKAERDILENAPYLDGFWGYLYQQNKPSVRAGQKILTDLADKEQGGADI